MLKIILYRILVLLRLKNFSKKIFWLAKQFAKFILFIPSILFLLFLKKNYNLEKKKVYSLRLTRKYFGHLAIESAMASAFQTVNKNSKIITSFKPSIGINNQYLNTIHESTFKISNDFFLIFLNVIYYNSSYFIKKRLKKYFEPFIDKNNFEREIKYVDYLETSLVFPWRSLSKDIIFHQKNCSRNIILALRTSHFNSKKIDVSSQPWRDVSNKDIHKLLKATCEIAENEKIYFFTNKKVWESLKTRDIDLQKILFIDESKSDILELINEDTLLINNGNGIGAAAYALGIKTLYFHHTVWQFWHTCHSNAFAFPCEYRNSHKRSNDLKEIIKLAFSCKSIIPYNFNKDFYGRNVFHNCIADIKTESLQNSIIESLNSSSLKKRKSHNYLGIDFYYKNLKEKYFWELFIKNTPSELRQFHKKITLNISTEFLNSYD